MWDLDNFLYEAFDRYYQILGYKGYVKDGDVYKLILAMFIDKIIHACSDYITEDDYRKIDSIITCLNSSSCIFPHIKYKMPTVPVYTRNLIWQAMDDSGKETATYTERLASL